jgi:hypothetical protein
MIVHEMQAFPSAATLNSKRASRAGPPVLR